MRRKIFALFMMTLLIVGIIYGCDKNDKGKDTKVAESAGEAESTENGTCISFGNVKKEIFVKNLKDLDMGEHTLLIGVDTDYSEKAVEQLNQLLQREGYDFGVVFCRLPDQCRLNGATLEFFQYLKEQGIGMDILPVWNADLDAVVEIGLLTDISEQLEEEGNLKEAFPERFWELTAVDSRNYGAGTFYVPPGGWAVNRELIEKYGFTQEELAKEITDMEDVFRTVNEGEVSPEFAAFVYQPRVFLESIPFVYVDKSLPIGYWHGEERNGDLVVNLFDTNKMKELVGTMNHYYEEGYVRVERDMTSQESFFMQADYDGFPIHRSDSFDTWTNTSGIELVRIPYYRQTTNNLLFSLNAISSWSEKKEEAWEFLTFVYENKEASTLLRYGIEGEDYSISGDTTVAGEGLSENIIYYRSLGNLQLTAPLFPYEDSDKTVLTEKNLNYMQDSPLFGFVFDTELVQEEVDAVRELYMELSTFRSMFAFEESAEYENWKEFYEAYRKELKNAGIDRIVDEMNRQIQEYLKK